VRGGQFQVFFLTNTLLANTRYPVSIYPVAVRLLLLVFLPLAAASYLPVSALSGRLPWIWALLGPPLAALVFGALSWSIWNWAFRSYESTGS
jgi:ABC-2 type transport system permease protein